MIKKFVIIALFLFITPNVYAVREWAEIYGGEVISIHEMPDHLIPVFRPSSFRLAVEITGMNPMPGPKWSYNITTGEFTAPAPISITNITSKAFYLRMTGAEREAFIISNDSKVRQFSYWLTLSGNVDLTDSKIQGATNYLENIGLIGPGRAAVILTIEIQ